MADSLLVPVLYGSVRSERQGIKAARFVVRELRERGCPPVLIDPLEIPPAMKNLLDHFQEEYFWRPAGIVCYSGGRWGGVRAAMQLRMTLAELGMVAIPTLCPIANVGEAFDNDGVPTDPRMHTQAVEFLDEFVWFMEALRDRRKNGVPY